MPTDQKRLSAYNAIADEVEKIVLFASQFPEISERLNLLRQGFMIMAVDENGFRSIHCTPTADLQRNLKIFLLFKGDTEVTNLPTVIKNCSRAHYFQPAHHITISMNTGETFRCLAFRFLHELGHALAAVKNGLAFSNKNPTPEHRTAEEMEIRTLDYKLMIEVGGPTYKSAAEKMALDLVRYHTQRQVPFLEGRGSALDFCFGSVQCLNVKKERDVLFQVLCEYLAADTHLPNPDHAKQLKLGMTAATMNWM